MTMRRTLPTAMPALVAALLLGACDGDKPATAPEGGAASPAKTGDSSGDKKSGPVAAGKGDKVKTIDGKAPGGDDRYALQIDAPEAKAGQPAQVTVKVVPKSPWHMNLDFPTSLKVTAPEGVTIDKADLKKADAAKLDESTCQFDVKFTPAAAGESKFTGKFKFAVCQDDACSPVTEDVEFKVAVK
jgi:hypothetical protein